MVQEVDQVPPQQERPRGVDSLIFDACGSRLANELGRRVHVTGTALEQGCDLDMPVVLQTTGVDGLDSARSVSAVTVHRQGHRKFLS